MTSEAEPLRRAIELHDAGELDPADQICREILESDPWHSDALHLVGVVAIESGRHESALAYISQAIAGNPAKADYYNSLGTAFAALGRVAQARISYEHAILLAPNDPRVRGNLAKLPGGQQAKATSGATARQLARSLPPLNASHEHRCLLIHIPKNGGTSIKRVLDLPGGGHPSWRFYTMNFPGQWERYTSFAVVRNPWDRAVSAYQHAKMKNSLWHNEKRGLHPDYELLVNKPFAECIAILRHQRQRLKHDSWLDQSHFIVDKLSPDKRIVVDALLRYETLGEDFAEFCRRLGSSCPRLPEINRSPRSRDYRAYYDEATRKMIEEVYQDDLETFGYSF